MVRSYVHTAAQTLLHSFTVQQYWLLNLLGKPVMQCDLVGRVAASIFSDVQHVEKCGSPLEPCGRTTKLSHLNLKVGNSFETYLKL